jgi:hypothetical protein
MEWTQGNEVEKHGDSRRTSAGLWVRAKRRGALVVRTCAGVAGGWTSKRRGTFLVLVVGVLALLSVIAIVYSAIGVGDRSRSAAVVKAERVSQVPDEVRDWIASIIAGDVLDTYYDELPGAGGRLRLRREATDYPFVEYNVVSSRASTNYNPATDQPFTVTGGFEPGVQGAYWGNWPQRWLASDPWLASTTPTWLHYSGTGSSATRNGRLLNSDTLADRERDWAKISNIAPDGRFVNLHNLRNNFEARPGISNGEMSFNLSLLNHEANTVAAAVVANPARTDFNVTIAANGPLYDRPAYWSNRQVGLFRPVTSAGDVGNAGYFNYQYADADGDGFYDSRWQELVNASDPNNVYSVITKDPKYRWFVAARIVDLSSMVNVNTATDLVVPPSAEVPVGTSPADVDLWRLLTGADLRDVYGYRLNGANITAVDSPFGYNALPGAQVSSASRPQEDSGIYTGFSPVDLGLQVGGHAYRSLRLSVASGVATPLSLVMSNNPNATPTSIAGQFLAPWDGAAVLPGCYAEDLGLTAANRLPLWKFDRYAGTGGTRTNDAGDGAFARREYFDRRVALLSGAARVSDATGNTTGYASSLVFGLPDLAELLTRRGVNDPEVRSPLEMVMAGRWSNGATPVDSVRYSPMRENRPLGMELAWDVNQRGTGDGLIDVYTGADGPWTAYRGRAADVRQYLTTVSGARPLASAENVDPTRLDARELKVDLIKELYTVATSTTYPTNWQNGDPRPENVRAEATRKIFRAYADALAGSSDLPDAWDPGGNGGELRTLFYGYNGPEKAAYFAAFSTINLQQMALRGSGLAPREPYTLILSEAGRDEVRNSGPAVFPEAFGYAPNGSLVRQVYGNRLDMDVLSIRSTDGATTVATPSRLAPASAVTTTPLGAATLYPAEAQPFITAVSCFTVYTDAPRSAGGDDDAGTQPNPPNGPFDPITIRPAVREENTDFLFRVLAFQITNPSTSEIYLSSDDTQIPSSAGGSQTYNMQFLDVANEAYPPMDTQNEFHYIRFGNRTFKLVALSEGNGIADDVPDTLEGKRYFDDDTYNARQSPNSGERPKPGFPLSRTGLLNDLEGEQQHAMMPKSGDAAGNGSGLGINAMRIRMGPGETIVCYALSQPPQAILDRMTNVELQTGSANRLTALEVRSSKTIRQFLKSQLKGQDVRRVYWVPEIDGPRVNASGQLVVGTGYVGSYNEEPNGSSTSPTPVFERWAPSARGFKAFGQLLQRHNTDGTTPDANKVVMLFKTRRYGLRAPGGSGPENVAVATTVPTQCWDQTTAFGTGSLLLYPRNDYTNDQLLDRFRLPVGPTGDIQDLDSRLRTASGANWTATRRLDNGYEGIQDDTTNPGPVEGYDSGVTLMMGAWAMRPEDPSAGASGIKVGIIPGYCIEPKSGATPGSNWNQYATTFGANSTFTQYPGFTDLSSTSALVGVQPRAWLIQAGGGHQVGGAGTAMTWRTNPVSARLALAPGRRGVNTNGVDAKPADPSLLGWTRPSIRKMYAQIPELAHTAAPANYSDGGTTGRLLRNLRKLRPTDALLPLAMGGIHAPNVSGTPDMDGDWITLGEMLAVTMGFDTGTPALASSVYDLFRPEAPDGIYPTDTPPRPLANGSLVLDDYVPFEMTGNGRGNSPVRFDRSQGDQRRGLQIPMALGVLDRITTLGYGSLTEIVPGVVNANTMPQMVARTIPMLAPNTARAVSTNGSLNGGFVPKGPAWTAQGARDLPAGGGTKNHYWWGQNGSSQQEPTNVNSYTTDLPTEIDVTAALIGYRDKGEGWMGLERVLRFNTTVGTNPLRPVPITSPTLLFSDLGVRLDADVSQRDGREASSAIPGVNEQPGFKSLGEIMCARYRQFDTSTPPRVVGNTLAYPYNIDFAGYDVVNPADRNSENVNNSFVGVDWAVRPASPALTGNGSSTAWEPNRFGNEPGEKLLIASGAMSSLSVRSDVFAVWFVLHGYQRTDCEGLGANDPLTPSIARRFMMVVDRSNVVKKGDSPKVLMFKEVPMN